jgi:membrane protein DedA with SNARE-associated domain
MIATIASIGDWVRDVVTSSGYPGLAALILIENLFPPIPSELILPLAGFYVGKGDLNFILAVLAATAGAVAGALIIYAIARFGGRRVLLRYGRILRIREKDLDRADDWFDRYGWWIVLGGRLIPGARSLVSIPAGLSEMPVGRFLALTTLGSAIWNTALVGAGWALGSNYEKVGSIVGPVSTVVIAVLAVSLIAGMVWLLRRGRRRRAEPVSG